MLRLKSLSGISSFSQGSLCSKWSPFALTHAWRRMRHCLTAVSMMRWSTASRAALMRSRNSSASSIRIWQTLPRLCRDLDLDLDLSRIQLDTLGHKILILSYGFCCKRSFIRASCNHTAIPARVQEWAAWHPDIEDRPACLARSRGTALLQLPGGPSWRFSCTTIS